MSVGHNRVPLGFTLTGERLHNRDELKAYLASVSASVTDPRERGMLLSRWNVENALRRRLAVLITDVCKRCWLQGPSCVCSSFPRPFPPAFLHPTTGSCQLLTNSLKVTLIMHPREVGCCYLVDVWMMLSSSSGYPHVR